MKITYREHYNRLIEKHGEEEGIRLYRGFLRSSTLETYIIKFGEKIGIEKYKKKKKPGSSYKKMIETYGKEEGELRYRKWMIECNQSLNGFIRRYGKDKGKERYDIFRGLCAIDEDVKKNPNSTYSKRRINTQVSFYLDECGGDYEKAEALLSKRQNTSSLDKFIKRYGKKEGEEKYIEVNKLKAITLENFIRLYGDIEGPNRWENYINKIKYAHTEEYYINKYGKVKGIRLRKELIEKKCTYITGRSKIGDEFCNKLFNELIKMGFSKNLYFSENEWKFFIHDEDYKMLCPDFFMRDYNIVIEFYGDYWHRNPHFYKDNISESIREKDSKRIDKIKSMGNQIIIVWEDDYRKSKNETIDKTIEGIINIINKNK